ncbi:uncharacterized protein LOC125944657 [Dermacentor silvarum]|uniref:uncharacterized protein LOC125944657 n=1 Tax=Dermacentor silvarum TaxID=543639 RepID=UPI002100D39D|nr:uncharacterized protein LOC125944657 [Dermacentor silvarum]
MSPLLLLDNPLVVFVVEFLGSKSDEADQEVGAPKRRGLRGVPPASVSDLCRNISQQFTRFDVSGLGGGSVSPRPHLRQCCTEPSTGAEEGVAAGADMQGGTPDSQTDCLCCHPVGVEAMDVREGGGECGVRSEAARIVFANPRPPLVSAFRGLARKQPGAPGKMKAEG